MRVFTILFLQEQRTIADCQKKGIIERSRNEFYFLDWIVLLFDEMSAVIIRMNTIIDLYLPSYLIGEILRK